ncbi:hypothetical protein [Shewanella baltica]|uniref:hypothetical protein n=1 Tax=Shewanella baltica TaxID=62322 RepID=UPI00217DD010|nr:hypothetical protein [Shewanella baltica]MCS6174111.1 hypothetical protein [Shewanella baltica]
MTLPTLKQLILVEIGANTAMKLEHITKERAEAVRLRAAGFSTQAFLHQWIVVEVAAKQLMCIYKYTQDTLSALNKTKPALKRAVQPHLTVGTKEQAHTIATEITDKSLRQMVTTFHGIFKPKAEVACRKLDIGVIKSSFEKLELTVDRQRLEYLLGTEENPLPDGITLTSKITIRERRNQLVHTNGHVSDETLTQLVPLFDYFFSLIEQLTDSTEQPRLPSSQRQADPMADNLLNAALQPNLNQEVADEPARK